MTRRPAGWGIALVVTALLASSVFASPAPVAQSGWQGRKSNPYSGLFQPAPLVKPNERTQATPPATPAKPKVVCGMTIIPANPDSDPKFTITAPDRSTTFTIRAIEPPICKP